MKAPLLLLNLIFLVTAFSERTKAVEIWGHRGAPCGEVPENTLPSFKKAKLEKADVIELDLQLSKDGQLVINHDPALNAQHCRDSMGREIKTPIPIESLTVDEIKKFNCGLVSGKLKLGAAPVALSTFDEFLAWFKKESDPQTKFAFEIKTEKQGPAYAAAFADRAIKLLRKHGLVERAVLESFDSDVLDSATRLEPRLKRQGLYRGSILSPLTGRNFCSDAVAKGLQVASPHQSGMFWNAKEIEICKKNGIDLVPWTIDDPTTAKKMIELGATGIFTNCPGMMRAEIEGSKSPSPEIQTKPFGSAH